jgi:hypothetical protein
MADMDACHLSRKQHPAGRTLIKTHVGWSGTTALVQIVNRHGSIRYFVVTGPTSGTRYVRVGGNDTIALVYDVEPGTLLSIVLDDDTQRLLYEGMAPSKGD